MTVAVILIGGIFIFSEILHFRRERELIRRLASRNEAEYFRAYEKKGPTPIPPSRAAMARWRSIRKDDGSDGIF